MSEVGILTSWDWPLLRQTPLSKGVWGSHHFSLAPIDRCDYLVVLNGPAHDTVVCCPPKHIWAIIGEPPDPAYYALHRGHASYARVYTTHEGMRGRRYLHSQPALPWHVEKDYDFLSSCGPPEKGARLSWVTSAKASLEGHRKRLWFLEQIRSHVDFDLYGRGFRRLRDKWDGLAPYKYSLAVENFRGAYYWTEKLADCFLTWTMPIYYGCTRIYDYFPREALIELDVGDPEAADQLHEIVESDRWERNLDALEQARNLVLNRYQLFPFVAREIDLHEAQGCSGHGHHPRPVAVGARPGRAQGLIAELGRRAASQSPGRVQTWLALVKRWLG